MDLRAESARLDKVMQSAHDGWTQQLRDLEASIDVLNRTLMSIEKTDMSENATYTITRDMRDMSMASKSILQDKINAYEGGLSAYVPSGYIQLGATFLIELVSVDGTPNHKDLQPFKLVNDAVSSGVLGLLSDKSAVGSAAIGHRSGDVIEVQAPLGTCLYRVREVY